MVKAKNEQWTLLENLTKEINKQEMKLKTMKEELDAAKVKSDE